MNLEISRNASDFTDTPHALYNRAYKDTFYSRALVLEVWPCVKGGPMVEHYLCAVATGQSIHGPVCFRPPTLHPHVLRQRRL